MSGPRLWLVLALMGLAWLLGYGLGVHSNPTIYGDVEPEGMRPFHWALAAVGGLIVLLFAGLIAYDVYAMYSDWPTLSKLGSQLRGMGIFALGLSLGFVVGSIAGHLWWPRAEG